MHSCKLFNSCHHSSRVLKICNVVQVLARKYLVIINRKKAAFDFQAENFDPPVLTAHTFDHFCSWYSQTVGNTGWHRLNGFNWLKASLCSEGVKYHLAVDVCYYAYVYKIIVVSFVRDDMIILKCFLQLVTEFMNKHLFFTILCASC